ncbi:helix-turn-helix domain-containing protein [Agromyces sp. NPDC057679]|uniref:helix-turn-helix domain-containing protein n=1 Tax=Agromyces sp. NPDC057679 TaxID=3346207 RepID=UPI00366F98BE
MPQVTKITFEEFRTLRGVSERTLLRWLAREELPGAVKVDGAWRIPFDAVRTPRPAAPPGAEVEVTHTRQRTRVIPGWTMADRLRKARESAGFEQRELAKRTGLSRQTISNAERGVCATSRRTVYVWALACAVNRDWLFTGQAPEETTMPGRDSAGHRDAEVSPRSRARTMEGSPSGRSVGCSRRFHASVTPR